MQKRKIISSPEGYRPSGFPTGAKYRILWNQPLVGCTGNVEKRTRASTCDQLRISQGRWVYSAIRSDVVLPTRAESLRNKPRLFQLLVGCNGNVERYRGVSTGYQPRGFQRMVWSPIQSVTVCQLELSVFRNRTWFCQPLPGYSG